MAKKEMEVVRGIDLQRYMGRWYEIASFPSFFQPKNGINTRATYTLEADGTTVRVLNETWSDGKRSYIEGTAYKADPKSDQAKLKVKFYVPPFLPIIPVVGDYWVLFLDEEYQYALIGQPSRKYLWVCSLIIIIIIISLFHLLSSQGSYKIFKLIWDSFSKQLFDSFCLNFLWVVSIFPDIMQADPYG